ncbi:hypothetical protein [Roseovarius atlanticus]|nr:hypothetical protein [Roseovarius atlanticus]QFT95246.1 hypothetical protein FIU86_20515 [Roseovarius sp. THAF9]
MDYPPWLPKPEYSRRGMLLALARCIYENWYRPEMHAEKGEILTFDNLCSGSLERVASVLQQTGFTSYIDHIGRRSVFNVGPDQFSELADAAQDAAISDNEIEETVVKLAEANYKTNLEIEKLAEMIASRS